MNVTTKTIARLAGVSERSVYRALKNKPEIDSRTKEKVLKLVKDYDYRLNAIARSMVMQKTRTIGLFLPDITTSFYAEITAGIEGILAQNDYTLILGKSDFNPEKEISYLNLFQERRVDGMILAAISKETLKKSVILERDKKIPTILVDVYSDGKDVDSIKVDNKKGAGLAIDYLSSLGHKKIAFISDKVVTRERRIGYEKALKNHHLPLNENFIIESSFISEDAGYRGVKQLLQLSNSPTAIFCARDLIAVGAISALVESELKVPENISVIGFDDINLAKFLNPPLTTVAQPKKKIGEMAARKLLEKIEDKNRQKAMEKILQPKLVVRNSCSPLK